jgi:hypothetical protein
MRIPLARHLPPQKPTQPHPPLPRLKLQQPLPRHHSAHMLIVQHIVPRAAHTYPVPRPRLAIPEIIHPKAEMHLGHEVREVVERAATEYFTDGGVE